MTGRTGPPDLSSPAGQCARLCIQCDPVFNVPCPKLPFKTEGLGGLSGGTTSPSRIWLKLSSHRLTFVWRGAIAFNSSLLNP
jgi:hypothetical protein